MSDDSTRPIIIKRKKVVAGGHHGGAWKIAYADFVTAMMAFFLLMWLLGSTSQGDLRGIASYFQSPLKIAMAGGSGSGDSSSILKGGGGSLTRSAGNVKNGDVQAPARNINLQALRAEIQSRDADRMNEVRARLDQAIQANPALAGLRQQIRMDVTADGLRVQIVDDQGRPMFDVGSPRVKDYMRELLRSIGRLLDSEDARVILSGHTDASPYSGGERGYSNWELSADRANASRRELLAGGLRDEVVGRTSGICAAAVLFLHAEIAGARQLVHRVAVAAAEEHQRDQAAHQHDVHQLADHEQQEGRGGVFDLVAGDEFDVRVTARPATRHPQESDG